MTLTYTDNLKLGLPTTGTESGTWGDVVNNQITTLVDQSISGTVSLTSMTNADYTLTNGNGSAANEARYMALLVPSSLTLTANRNIIVPSTSKMYVVKNATTGGFSVVVKTSAGTGIEVPNGNTMLLYCDGTNVIVAFNNTNIVSQNGGQLAGLRNRIINGGMAIAQRGTAATTNVAGTTFYSVDRFFGQTVASGASISFAQSSDGTLSLAGPYHLFQQTNTIKASLAAGDYSILGQNIEGFNVADLKWGTAAAKPITISFRARVDNVGSSATISVALRNSVANRSYVKTITVTNSSASYSVTIPGDTTGTWLTDSNAGIQLNFGFACGTTFATSTLNAWQAGNFIAANTQTNLLATLNAALDITDVQLELGSISTPFEQRPYGMELALCQRYAWVVSSSAKPSPWDDGVFGSCLAISATDARGIVIAPVPMRAIPAIQIVTGALAVYNSGLGFATPSGMSVGGMNGVILRMNLGGLSGLGVGQYLELNTSTAATKIILSSEL